MNLLSHAEILKSKQKAERLTLNFQRLNTDWGRKQIVWFKIEIIIEDLLSRKIITTREEKELRRVLAPLLYKHILADPEMKNEKIKKIVEVSLLNDWLGRMGFGVSVRVIDGEHPA